MRPRLRLAASVVAAACVTAGAHPAPGICVDSRERVYFVDFTRDRIMVVPSPGEPAHVFVDGAREQRFSVPHHLTLDSNDNVHVASDRGATVWRFDAAGHATQEYPVPGSDRGTFAGLGAGGSPFTIDEAGNLYTSNEGQATFAQVLRIAPSGLITSLAGDRIGRHDGPGAEARFGELHGAAMACSREKAGATLYITDTTAVRRVSPEGQVTTLAGGAERGLKDAKGGEARFGDLAGLCLDRDGNVYVADRGNGAIRKITPDGTVSTVPMKPLSEQPGQLAPRPVVPVGVAWSPSGALYILDYPGKDRAVDSPRVTKLAPDGALTVVADLTHDLRK